ncbi:MAG: hypothetical protein KDB71_12260 [Mycobacterium sp.]|nr:hypothetical protein [Mycobacterium sp.]
MTAPTKTRHRRVVSLTAAALAMPAAIVATTGASASPVSPRQAHWQPQIVTAAASGTQSQAVAARYIVAENAASRLATFIRSRRPLPPGICDERGLQVQTIRLERAISAAFPEIHQIGGVRADALKWHPNGLAIDVMVPDWSTPEGKDLGDRIAAFALANTARFGIEHVIWQRVYHSAAGDGKLMADLGDDDANHYTHVHIATHGGGYPTGVESYFV